MAKTTLTDRGIKALKPAEPGRRYDLMDSVVPGLGIRVTDKGMKTFVLVARYPGSPNPTRRALGEYGALTLEKARETSRRWLEQIGKGIDPKAEADKERRAVIRERENTFEAVAETFIARHVTKLARPEEAARQIRTELVARWARRPITDITRQDVVAMAEEIGDRAPYLAHVVFGHIRKLYNWAIARGTYGLEVSPCDRVRLGDLIGRKEPRTRVLIDGELRALWAVAGGLGYPYGPVVRLLMLTGQRESEVAGARWSEIDLAGRLWLIPKERMKGRAAHVVPLSDAVVMILGALPRFSGGGHVFSTTDGVKPVNGFSKCKARIDARLAAELGAAPPPWVLHDIRRTVRTGLSTIGVADMVRGLVIAHARPGLHKVYDQHAYLEEKRQALDLWAARLSTVVGFS
jgi:integrase